MQDAAFDVRDAENRTFHKPLISVDIDLACVKTPKPRESFFPDRLKFDSLENVCATIAIWTNVCSIAVVRRRVFTQPRPISDMAGSSLLPCNLSPGPHMSSWRACSAVMFTLCKVRSAHKSTCQTANVRVYPPNGHRHGDPPPTFMTPISDISVSEFLHRKLTLSRTCASFLALLTCAGPANPAL